MQSEWVADLIGIRTSAVERAMGAQEAILRAIDGRVKWGPSSRGPGDFGRLVSRVRISLTISRPDMTHYRPLSPWERVWVRALLA